MKILLLRTARIIATIILCAAVLTCVWFTVEALYIRYVIAPFESADHQQGGDVLLALNDKLEKVLLEQAANADAERRRLEALLQAGGLNREQEADIQKQIQILSDREKQLNTQVREAKEEEAVITASLETRVEEPSEEEVSIESAMKDRRIQELEDRITVLQAQLDARAEDVSITVPAGEEEDADREISTLRGEVERLAAQVDSLNDALQAARSNDQEQQIRIEDLGASLIEVRQKLRGSEVENAALRDDLKTAMDKLEVTSSAQAGLFEAAEISGVFHQVGGELQITLNPGQKVEVLEQGTFSVHPPGEPEMIKTRILIEEKEGKTIFKRYPGQPSPEEGDWF